MQLDISMQEDVLIIKTRENNLDARLAVDFKDQLLRLTAEHSVSRVVLDLEHVEFVDSSGLRAIVSCLKALGRDGDLVICNMQDSVQALFQLTRMDRVFRIFTNEQDALAQL